MTSATTEIALSPRKRNILHINREILINILDAANLLEGMYMKGVIDAKQKEVISALQSDSEKNEALFDILQHGSSDKYRSMVKCLRENNKEDVADILKHGGGRPLDVYEICLHACTRTGADREGSSEGEGKQKNNTNEEYV